VYAIKNYNLKAQKILYYNLRITEKDLVPVINARKNLFYI